MYKSGIWRSDDLANSRTTLGRTRRYSYSLLKTPVPHAPADIARFETVIRTVRLSSGIFRTTYRSRFADLDALTQQVLNRTFSADRTLEIHDVGASDGLLSTQWAERVFSTFPRARMTASDILLCLTEAVSRSGETYIMEPDGTPIQYIRPPFVVSIDVREPAVYPLNLLVRAWGRRRLDDLQSCSAAIRWNGIPDDQVITRGGWTFRQIPLVHPAVLSFARNRCFTVTLADVFKRLPLKHDVVRIMNLFQPNIFAPEKIQQGVQVALDSLSEDGIFIAGRTLEDEDRHNHASIFQKAHGRVRLVEKLGKGFEFSKFAFDYEERPTAV